MKLIFLTLLSTVIYAADASGDEYVNFVGEDREFKCEGAKGRWILPNKTEILEKSSKFDLEKNENESNFVVKNVNSDDVGDYRCNTDKGDKIFTLKTYFPQTVTQSLKSEVVNENGEVSFRCRSIGAPAAVFTWWFGDQELYESENIKISSGTLTLKNIQLHQAGEYTCIADQKLETNRNIQERSFGLVVVPPYKNYQKPTEIVAKENYGIELTCYANTTAKITLDWHFNDHLIVDEHGNQATNNTLILHKVQRSHAGIYTCQIAGHFQRREFKLIIEHAPVIKESSPIRVEGSIGSKAVLTCAVEALPTPQFRWFQNGFEIFDNIETFTFLSRLRVELKSKDSFKDYTCVVTNDVGQNKLEFKLVESEGTNGSNIKTLSMFMFIISAFVLIA